MVRTEAPKSHSAYDLCKPLAHRQSVCPLHVFKTNWFSLLISLVLLLYCPRFCSPSWVSGPASTAFLEHQERAGLDAEQPGLILTRQRRMQTSSPAGLTSAAAVFLELCIRGYQSRICCVAQRFSPRDVPLFFKATPPHACVLVLYKFSIFSCYLELMLFHLEV